MNRLGIFYSDEPEVCTDRTQRSDQEASRASWYFSFSFLVWFGSKIQTGHIRHSSLYYSNKGTALDDVIRTESQWIFHPGHGLPD